MARPKTKTTAESINTYIRNTYARISLNVPKDIATKFREKCETEGTNPNRIINEWIAAYVASVE